MPKAPKTTKRRKPDAERKERAITIWVSTEQGTALDEAAGGYPVSTWARVELLRIAEEKKGASKP